MLQGKIEEAEAFDREKDCQHLEVQVGAGEMMKGFEDAIIGMTPSEKKTFTLDPGEAYGERDEQLRRSFRRADLPFDFNAEEGQVVALQTDQGYQILATVLETNEDQVILDLNHPLAGKSLSFEVEIEDVL